MRDYSAIYCKHPLLVCGLRLGSRRATKKPGRDCFGRRDLWHRAPINERARDTGPECPPPLRNCDKAQGTPPFVSPAFWTKTKATRCFHFPISIPKRFGSEHSGNRFALMLALPQPPIRVPPRLLFLVRAEHEKGRRAARNRNDPTVLSQSKSPTVSIRPTARKRRPPPSVPAIFGAVRPVSS